MFILEWQYLAAHTKRLRTRSSVGEKQDHYVNSSWVSSKICHINITPSNKKCKLLYICCNWKLYYTLVESPIYLITISSHKISFRKVECNSGEVAIGISIMELCLDWDLSKSESIFVALQISRIIYHSIGEKTRDRPAFMTLCLNPGSKTIFNPWCLLNVFWPLSPFSDLCHPSLTSLWSSPSVVTPIHSFVQTYFSFRKSILSTWLT